MHDLRRQALESGKTVSRKARSRQVSTANSKTGSPAVSRTGSRVASTNVSDDDGDLSDTTTFSATSIDDLQASDEVNAPLEIWTQRLNDIMDDIIDRKRSSVQGREESLNALSYMLMAHYAQDVVKAKVAALLPALLKCIKSGQSEKETLLAIKALALVLITDPTETICGLAFKPLKLAVENAELASVKTAAIHALGIATFYGGVVETETLDVMTFLQEIVESDGAVIGADDEGAVVTAAMEEWALLATQIDDMEDISAEPMDAFVEQLESADVSVQIAAGESIALLYEKSHTELEDDEELERRDDGAGSDDEDVDSGETPMVKRYNVYDNHHQLCVTLEALSKASSRRVSKRDKKSLHTNFADILNSVEHPTRGPRYSKALNAETGKAYGSRISVGVGARNSLHIRTWEQWHRLKSLRRVLQSGFLIHYADNEVVFDTLPVMLQGA